MKYPKVIYKGPAKDNSWCRWAVNRVKRKNNSTNIRFVGDTGSGKSWSGLSVAESCAKLLGYRLSKDNIYFSIKDVIQKVAEEEPKPGTIFFIDEQQVGAGSKDHASKKNKAYSAFLSTVRSNRYIFITTLPFSDMEDKQLRRLFHVEVETQGINESAQTVNTRPRYLEHSRLKDKTYRKRLVIVFKDESTGFTKARKLSTWDIKRPSQEIVDIYEPMKREFKRKLYKKLNEELNDFESAKEDKTNPSAAVTELNRRKLTDYQKAIMEIMQSGIKVQKEINEYLKQRGFYSDPGKVCRNMDRMANKGVVFL
jgi:ABC-type dipeptide/oligopeptide/nickel transport system ATPase component